MIFFGIIKDGELKIKSREKVLSDIKAMKDGYVKCEIHYANQRTINQNRYYWGVIVWEIRNRLQDLGNTFTDENVHDFLKDKFNSKMMIGAGGEVIGEVGQSTTEISKEDFSIYLEKIFAWCVEFLDLHIPPPMQQLYFY